jgi:hypothetical protein
MNSYNEIFDHILSNNLNELERAIKGLDLNSKNTYGSGKVVKGKGRKVVKGKKKKSKSNY